MSLDAVIDDNLLENEAETTSQMTKPIKNAAQTQAAQWVKANPDEAARLIYVQQSTDDVVIEALLETAF